MSARPAPRTRDTHTPTEGLNRPPVGALARYLLARAPTVTGAMGRARCVGLASVPGYPNSSITELKFPSLNPPGVLQLVKAGSLSAVALVSTWGFSEPTT